MVAARLPQRTHENLEVSFNDGPVSRRRACAEHRGWRRQPGRCFGKDFDHEMGNPDRLLISASAWKSRCTWRIAEKRPGRGPRKRARASLLTALPTRENPSPGVRRRRRLSPMELQLSQLCGRALRHAARAPAHAVVDRGRRRRRPGVGARERLARYPRAAQGAVRSCSRVRTLRDTRTDGHRAGRRPDRSHHGPLHAARSQPPVAHLVHRPAPTRT